MKCRLQDMKKALRKGELQMAEGMEGQRFFPRR